MLFNQYKNILNLKDCRIGRFSLIQTIYTDLKTVQIYQNQIGN